MTNRIASAVVLVGTGLALTWTGTTTPAEASVPRVVRAPQNIYANFAARPALETQTQRFSFSLSRDGVLLGSLACQEGRPELALYHNKHRIGNAPSLASIRPAFAVTPTQNVHAFTIFAPAKHHGGTWEVEVALAPGTSPCALNLVHGGMVENFQARSLEESTSPDDWGSMPFIVQQAPPHNS